ncbi:MAG: glycosyltransferase [Micrococcales bacterium]|nr:glycosyltransferase [Micrococcales bacterium]
MKLSDASRHAPTGSWDGLVVMCAGTSWDGVWFPDKHIANRLTDYAPVLYVDPPMSLLTPLRNPHLKASLAGPRLRLVRPGLARLTPVTTPGISRPGLRELSRLSTRRALARAVRSLGGSVRAVVSASLDDVFGVCGEDSKVLYGTDDFAAGGALMNISDSWLRHQEGKRLAEADAVVAISPTLADRWRGLGHEVTMIANGCDADLYADTDSAPWPDDVSLPGPIAVFVGHLSERIDLRMLEAVADTGESVLLVGPRQQTFELGRVESLLARPNVQWVGPKPFESLPSYLRVGSVGITPYADTDFNRGSFPLKTLEYLAAGRAAVVSDLPAARWLASDDVHIAADPRAFADATVAALRAPVDPAAVERRQAFARSHSWAERAREFATLLGLADSTP